MVEPWSADQIKAALETALVDDLGLKPRAAYAAVRVAVTGRVSPLLFESIELLGRDRTMRRLGQALATAAGRD